MHTDCCRLGFLGIFLVLAAGLSCGSSGNDADTACTPGRSIQCAGVNGCLGTQVCSADGFSYEACNCSTYGGTGGAQGAGGYTTASMMSGGQFAGIGSSQGYFTGGARSTVGGVGANTGGAFGASGGSTSTSTAVTVCSPSDMTNYAYPAYVHARRMPGSCTEQSIQQYYANCYSGSDCSAFGPGGAQSLCGTCLNPSQLTESTYGPLLKLGNASSYYYETNIAGCEELMGEVDCAPQMQVEFLCEYNACVHNCPLVDSTSFDPMLQCMSAAQRSSCSSKHNAAACLKSAASVAACSASSFQAQFIAIARVFCL